MMQGGQDRRRANPPVAATESPRPSSTERAVRQGSRRGARSPSASWPSTAARRLPVTRRSSLRSARARRRVRSSSRPPSGRAILKPAGSKGARVGPAGAASRASCQLRGVEPQRAQPVRDGRLRIRPGEPDAPLVKVESPYSERRNRGERCASPWSNSAPASGRPRAWRGRRACAYPPGRRSRPRSRPRPRPHRLAALPRSPNRERCRQSTGNRRARRRGRSRHPLHLPIHFERLAPNGLGDAACWHGLCLSASLPAIGIPQPRVGSRHSGAERRKT